MSDTPSGYASEGTAALSEPLGLPGTAATHAEWLTARALTIAGDEIVIALGEAIEVSYQPISIAEMDRIAAECQSIETNRAELHTQLTQRIIASSHVTPEAKDLVRQTDNVGDAFRILVSDKVAELKIRAMTAVSLARLLNDSVNPVSAHLALQVACVERDARRYEQSLELVAIALECRPGWPPGVWHAADLHVRLDRAEEAKATIESLEALRADAGYDKELKKIASLALELGATSTAERIAGYLLARDDESAIPLTAGIALASGDESRALIIARLAAASTNPTVRASAAEALMICGRVEEMLALLPGLDSATPYRRVTLAWRLRRHGFLQEARGLLGGEDHPGFRRILEKIDGSLRVLQQGWRPAPRMRVTLASIPNRVLHVTGSSLPQRQSGYTIRTHQIALAQQRAGLEPHVVTQIGFPATNHTNTTRLEMIDRIPHHRLPHVMPDVPVDAQVERNIELMAPILDQVRPSVLHPASDYRNAMIALGLREVSDLPVIYEVRGFWEENWLSRQPNVEAGVNTDEYRGRRDVELRCMQDADHVVTLGETMMRHIIQRGVDPEKVTVVPNGVDRNSFYPVERDHQLARRLGIGDDDVVVGCISTLAAYEGFEDLVEAVAILRDRGQEVRCLLVGDGPERQALTAHARDLGISEKILLPGRMSYDQVLPYYGLIDIFALPRRPHRVCDLVTPLKPYEAMASGCALVVSDRDALQEIVKDGETGFVVKSVDPSSLADTIEHLADDPQLRRSIAHAGSEWVRSHRSWERNAVAYQELYAKFG